MIMMATAMATAQVVPVSDQISNLIKDEIESSWSVEVAVLLLSQNIGPSGIWYTKGPVLQTESTISHESGLSFTLWTSKGFKSGDGISDEVDFILGYEKVLGGALFSFGAGYYDFLRATEGNVWSLSAEMSREFRYEGSPDSLTPAVRFEKAIPASSDCPYGSAFMMEVSTEVRLGLNGFDLYLTPALVFDKGQYGAVRHFMWRWEFGAKFEVRGITVSPTVTLFRPSEIGVSEEDMLMLEKETVVGVRLTKSF